MQIQTRSIKEQYNISSIMSKRKKNSINNFKCPNRNIANKLCINNDCRFEAFFCQENDCNSCQQMHENCISTNICQLKEKIDKRKKLKNSTAKNLATIEEKSLKKYMKETSQFLRYVQQGKYDYLSNELKYFQECEGISGVCGPEINRLLDALRQERYRQKMKSIITDFTKKVKETMQKLQIERETLFNSVFGVKPEQYPYHSRKKVQQSEFLDTFDQSTEEYEGSSFLLPIIVEDYSFPLPIAKHQQLNLPQIQQQEIESSLQFDKNDEYIMKKGKRQQNQKSQDESSQSQKKKSIQSFYNQQEIPQNVMIESLILRSDKRGSLKQKYLMQQLQRPKILELIFRASEHQFSSHQFHQICDEQNETVCIVKTEFNRTIAGYAHPEWYQTGNLGNFVKDEQKKSFLLQLDEMKRLDLIPRKYKYALYCTLNYGPSFGADLVISDKCHDDIKSRTSFPYSYNNLTSKYLSNQKSKTFLCGTKREDGSFKVLQYEVFKVIR